MPKQEDEQQFTDILLLLISIECLVSLKECIKYVESYRLGLKFGHNIMKKVMYLELASYVCELLVDSFDLGLLALAVPDVGNEDCEPSHAIATNSGHLRLFTEAEREVKCYPVTTRYVNVPWSCQSHTQAFERFPELKLTELSHNKWNKESQ